MTVLRDLIAHTAAGGWGSDAPNDGLFEVHVIRGADFPSVDKQRLIGLPVRYESNLIASTRCLEADDLIIEISGGTKDRPTGRVVRITERALGSVEGIKIPASFCRLIRINRTLANPAFIFYSLRNHYNSGGTWAYQNQSTGLANFRFPQFAESYEIEPFSVPEQSAIAEVLGALDDKIAANTQAIDLLDQLGAAEVMRHTTGTHVALSSIAVITMGSSPPGADLSDVPAGIPFYQGVRDFGRRFPGFRIWTEKPVRTAEAGDTLLSVRAPVGRTNLARVRSCIGRGVASLRSTTGMPFTLYHLLATSERAWLPFESEGTVFGSINRKQLGAVLVPTIKPSAQTGLESRLASFESLIAAAITANEHLAATRDALLPALMSGKLRIKDAERVVSHAV